MIESEKLIINFAIKSRLLYIFISFFSNYVLEDHYPTDVFLSFNKQSSEESVVDSVVNLAFRSLTHWDSQHFYHIAQYGYTYEHNLAFFPLYPTLLSISSKFISFFCGNYMSQYSALIMSSVLLSSFLFIAAVVTLYRLSLIVLNSDYLARKAALFYCVSPAYIFFMASYSEVLYSFLVLNGMLQWVNGQLFYASIFFGFASHTRSNGIMNIGFIIHACIFLIYDFLLKNLKFDLYSLGAAILMILRLVFYCIVVLVPYILFQFYGYLLFCTDFFDKKVPKELIIYGRNNGFVLPFDEIVWCNDTIPMPYSYVQSHYWNVGFLKYYSFKQLPNFALAFPVIVIILMYSLKYLKYYWHLFYLIRYIYMPHLKPKDWRCPRNNELLPRNAFVFIIHAFILTVFCIFYINVQVTTRIICSSSPILFWIMVKYFSNSQRKVENSNGCCSFFPLDEKPICREGYWLKAYFLIYSVLGVVLFSNNYPWT